MVQLVAPVPHRATPHASIARKEGALRPAVFASALLLTQLSDSAPLLLGSPKKFAVPLSSGPVALRSLISVLA
ncbi:hypothetical protein GN956_G13143 [Arapaima gigas]